MGPELFAFAFGEQWQQSGEIARWMALWLFFQFVSSPLSTTFSVTENEKQGLVFQLLMLVSRIVAISIGAWFGDFLITIILFSGVSVICYLSLLVWITYIVGNHVKTLLRPTLNASGFAIVIVTPILLVIM